MLYLKINQLVQEQKLKKLDKEWLKKSINHLVKDSLLCDDPQVEEQISNQFKTMMENQALIMNQRVGSAHPVLHHRAPQTQEQRIVARQEETPAESFQKSVVEHSLQQQDRNFLAVQ